MVKKESLVSLESLSRKTFSSIAHMGVQHAANMVCLLMSTALVIRNLDRAEYGALAIVVSYQLVFSLFDISVANIFIRNLDSLRKRLDEIVNSYLVFDFLKASVIIGVGGAVAAILWIIYKRVDLLGLLAIVVCQAIAEFLGSTPKVYLSANFQQSKLTRVILTTSLCNVALSAGTYWIPDASYVAVKNLVISIFATILSWRYFILETGFVFRWRGMKAWGDIETSLVGFSLWSHLIGISTDIVYRADMIILGWCRVPLRVVGNYNVALQLANMAKIVPQILQTNASLSISKVAGSKRKIEEVVWLFIKGSILLSLVTAIGYGLIGKIFIGAIAKSDVNEIFEYGWWILGGLIVFNLVRPIYSYIIIAKSVRSCLLYLSLPASAFAIASYYVGAKLAGAQGLAIANFVNGVFMMLSAVVYVTLKTDFRCPWAIVTETDRNALRALAERLGTCWSKS